MTFTQKNERLVETVMSGNESLAIEMLKEGADPFSGFQGWDGLTMGITKGLRGFVKEALRKACAQEKLDSYLFIAASYDEPELCQLLIEKGGRTSFSVNGTSGLHIALGSGFDKSAIVLIKNGADLVTPDRNGKTPFELASQNGCQRSLEKIKSLLASSMPGGSSQLENRLQCLREKETSTINTCEPPRCGQ